MGHRHLLHRVQQAAAAKFYDEYQKIFIMFFVSALVITNIRQLWALYLIVTGTLCYIAWEINDMYFFQGGYMYVYKQGYAGLDNNGAALMLSMGVPLALFAWDGIQHRIRWVFLACIPLLVHAVLTSYSRGAMLALIVSIPIYFIRARHKKELSVVFLGIALMIPVLAGKEIQERFFTIDNSEEDGSAQSRLTTWGIGWRMALERPIFGYGVRNSNLFTQAYGADMEGRAIHSQYLQIAADSGLVGLGAYLLVIGAFLLCLHRVRRRQQGHLGVANSLLGFAGFFLLKHWARPANAGRNDPDMQRAYTIACGIEGAMLVFCFGSIFLSLENFELPYILFLMSAQLWAVIQLDESGASQQSACLSASPGQSAGHGEVERMRRPVRVGFVLHAMQVAGAEVLVADTVRRLRGRIEPTIFCLDAVGPLGEQMLAEGCSVVNLQRRPGRDLRVALRMARHITERRISVVHAHQYSPFFYAALAKLASRRRFRLILTEHGRHFPDVVSPLRRGVNRIVLDRLADEVNAVCEFSARALSRNDGFAGRRIDVIENGIDVERYRTQPDHMYLRDRLGLRRERRYVAMVARFHPVKDHAMLLRAFAQVAVARNDVDLLLVGDGPLRQAVEAQVRVGGIESRVKFMGVRGDVPEILQAIDLFALTSVSEAASLTLLEAMAAARPVVVTDVGGNPEIVRRGIDGLLVPRGDDAAAAGAILYLLGHPTAAAAMGVAGRARVEERYRLNRTIERYYGLYRSERSKVGRRKFELQRQEFWTPGPNAVIESHSGCVPLNGPYRAEAPYHREEYCAGASQ